jgi:hypothetical protein
MNSNPHFISIIDRINTIDSKFHRDLMALLSTPFVFTSFFADELLFPVHDFKSFDQHLEWYKSIENVAYPDNLEKLRLGKYAEELLCFYFQNNPKYSLLGYNMQLIDDKLTVGEIDYLLEENATKLKIHLELAIKFFLKIKINEEHQWIGPSTKDNLSKKKNKLLKHQLQLVPNFNKLLPLEFQNTDFKPQLLLKGAEFIPFEEYTVGDNPFENAWWLHQEKLTDIQRNATYFSIIPNRKDWVFPFNERLEKFNFKQLEHEIVEYLLLQNEIMIARFQEDHTPIDRGFVVRSNWPF